MDLRFEEYAVREADRILTPALLIYPELVDANIRATLRMTGGDANRWRPHIKTAKMAASLRKLIGHGVSTFKCSTTLELLAACEAGARDVLLAYPVVGANARRARQIADQFPSIRVSGLIESPEQAASWRGSDIGLFIDINPGMDRTGISQDRTGEIIELARGLERQFRGLHYYDGHMSGIPASMREAKAHEGYGRLLQLVKSLESAGILVGEIITSGTPAAPFAMSYPGFRGRSFVHRISPGTVVFNDLTSLEQLPDFGYRPAALVLSTVVSHPAARVITCDAGHKSVSADAGVPTCAVIGHPELKPLKPSEEHLPIEADSGADLPRIGEKIYLLPRHVCPTVNNFDKAVMVVDGRVAGMEAVTARGHESLIEALARS